MLHVRFGILSLLAGVCLSTGALLWTPAVGIGQDNLGAPISAEQVEGTIVFVIPSDLDAATRTSLEEALLASLSLVRARVVLLDGPSSRPSMPLEERIPSGMRLAKEHSATGVLWLDVRLTDHWFLYAMDAEAERVVVRPLLVRAESIAAAVESIAVISRASAQALMQGEPVQGEPVFRPEPQPIAAPPAPVPAPAPAPAFVRLQLSVAYLGTTYASQQPWQSGLQLGAAWAWRSGWLLSLGYAFIPAHHFGDELAFSVQRRPFNIGGGYALRIGETLTVSLAGFVGLGSDVFINDFDYVGGAGGSVTLLDADRVRLRALAGVAILH